MPDVKSDSAQTIGLLELVAQGDRDALERVLARYQPERISQAVNYLSDSDREILLMRHVENLPYEEIACLLEIEATAARRRYGRALIRLQRVLGKCGLLE